jgi:T4 RnlA family RNA ligase
MLAIQKFINKNGLAKAITKFNLKSRVYENKILLKYDQLSAPSLMAEQEVQECRGLILEINSWKVMSLAFTKFFNAEEGNAHKIDWDSAHVLEKLDGTCIQVYYDWNDMTWYAGTTGTADGEGEVNNKTGTTFNQLFWKTVKEKYNLDTSKFNAGYTYVFELTTPYNIVVKPHGESSATLLTVRNLETLEELSFDELTRVSEELGVPRVKAYDLNVKNVGTLLKTFDNMTWHDEGYVVVDAKHNRVKIKNPAYVHAHHLKGKMGNHHIMGIIKTNEIEEFIATFKERESEIRQLEKSYNDLRDKLNKSWYELSLLKPKNITPQEKKRFAMNVFDFVDKNDLKQFSGMFFSLNEGKINTVNEYLINYDDKKLYHFLID